MADRRFVLAPLADLAPDLRHPVTRKTIREMLDAAPKQAVRPFASSR
jgi:7,8-dihydro-6-hydroxymethylpterin-pyrophosphokinase